jgi:hypothetical protein
VRDTNPATITMPPAVNKEVNHTGRQAVNVIRPLVDLSTYFGLFCYIVSNQGLL